MIVAALRDRLGTYKLGFMLLLGALRPLVPRPYRSCRAARARRAPALPA